jgi:hypothetical protein
MLAMRGAATRLAQLQKCQGTQYDSDLLDTTAYQFPQFFLILAGYLKTQGGTSHALLWPKTFSI